MTIPQITSHTVLELRIETPMDVIYFTSRPGDLPERWFITNMQHELIGELRIEQGYGNLYIKGKRVYQNDASADADHFDDNDRRLAALNYIAQNIYNFAK